MLKKTITLIFLISALVSLLGLASAYISPELFWWLAPFGLLFPFSYAMLLLCFCLQFFFLRKHYWLTFLFIIVLFPMARLHITWSKSRPIQQLKDSDSFIITSFNSMLFDLYNWFNNYKTRPKILNSLYALHPDILCLQEFYTSDEPGDFNNVDSVIKMFSLPFFHVEYKITLRNTDHWGLATFSRFKIVRTGKIDFPTHSNNLCIYTDILWKDDTVRIYNFHLQSYGISSYLNKPGSSYKKKNILEKFSLWVEKFRQGYMERARQADWVSMHVSSCPYPVILCGDLNDVPCSYAYRKLKGNFTDAFVTDGFGLGRTYSGKGPRFRIDYIFYSQHWICKEYYKSKITFTDHYPISAVFELKK